MIIQELRKLQEADGYLSQDRLGQLSESLGEPLHRLHEVASFFPHFRTAPPPKVEVLVCRDMACHLRGAQECRRSLEEAAARLSTAEGQVEVHGVSCLGQCDRPVAVAINDKVFAGKPVEELKEMVRRAHSGEEIRPPRSDRSPLPWKIDPYGGKPEYGALRRFVEEWNEYTAENPEAKRKRPSELLAEMFAIEGKLKALQGASGAAPQNLIALRRNPAARVLAEMADGNLRGMGGAGFPAAEKWKSVCRAKTNDLDPELVERFRKRGIAPPPAMKYVVCNGDESEPGTFKDREILVRYPHLVLEGMILGGLITGALQGHVYIRHEYHDQIEAVSAAIDAARKQGLCGKDILGTGLSFELEDVFVSPGGYICGEQNALLAAMEDRRAEPRNKPPSISVEGLRGQPTLLNNVETFAWVPAIATHTGLWYAGQGLRGATGLRFVSISGDVARPGVYEVPFGQSVRELVFDSAGGMRDGQKLRAIAPSGPSGGFLPAEIRPQDLSRDFAEKLVRQGILKSADDPLDILDLPLDIDLLRSGRLMLGAAFVVYGERSDMLDQALNCVEFYRHESCGKCVPCRVGSDKLVHLLSRTLQRGDLLDTELITELGSAMRDASICGLGQVAANPITSVIRYFREDIDRHQATERTNGHAG
ncbi:MAG: NADH-ubiquinone oxidoreductase-F iron-sulfur binding region domain-containing protein [Pirellulales bacterium]